MYNWGKKLKNLSPITCIEVETARFDTQKLITFHIVNQIPGRNASRLRYSRVLNRKVGREFAQCDKAGVPLQIEHIHPKSKGGTDRISNLVMTCMECNIDKGDRNIRSFLAHDPKRLVRFLDKTKRPLKHAAAVNGIIYAIGDALKLLGLPIKFYTGGRT